MIVGTNTPVFAEGSFSGKLARIAAAGYRGLGICFSVVECTGKHVRDLKDDEIDKYKRRISGFKRVSLHACHMELKPLAIHPEYRRISQEECLQSLVVAGKLCADTVVMHPGDVPTPPNYGACQYDSDEVMKDLMLRVDNTAGEHGVKACWETGCGYFDPFEKFELIRELDLHHTGICLDVGHMMLVWHNFGVGINKAITTFEGFIRRFGDLIYDMHIHDWIADAGASPHGWNDHQLVGEGEIDWAEVFGALVEVGYDGLLTCEYHPLVVGDDDAKLAANRERICEMIRAAGGEAE